MNISHAGFTIVEILGVMAIGAMSLVGMSVLIDKSFDVSKGQKAADYQAQVANAASKFITSNYDQLLTDAQATIPKKINLQNLIDGKFLPTGFASVNAYSQTSCILVLKPTPTTLSALIVTEAGEKISDQELANVASNSGPGAGFISNRNSTEANSSFWTLNSSDLDKYLSVNCSGTPTNGGLNGGHIATQLFFSRPSNGNDVIYRNAIPGRPALNQMQTPLLINATVTANTPDAFCSADNKTWGKLAHDANGAVLSCENGTWQTQSGFNWKDPYPSFATLPSGGNQTGDSRVTLDTAQAYVWNGSMWILFGMDQNGNLTVGNTLTANTLEFVNTNVVGDPCTANSVSKSVDGKILSCQSGVWQQEAGIASGISENDCSFILPTIKTADEPFGCSTYSGAMNHNPVDDTWSATITRPISLQKNGVISVDAYSEMHRQLWNQATDLPSQFRVDIDVIDNDTGLSVAHNQFQSQKLFSNINRDSGAGYSGSLLKAVPKNTNGYSVQLTTTWSIFDNGATIPFEANWLNPSTGKCVEHYPLLISWTINSYY